MLGEAISVEVTRLKLEANEILVLRLPELSAEGISELVQYLRSIPALRAVPGGIVILPHGCELLAVTPAEVPPCAI